ncbi:MAG TPA: FCD domain-containing protein [Aldersonia sp.]
MTDLEQRMRATVPLSRTEQTALAIGQLAEASAAGARLGTKRELQHQCGVAMATVNEALRILQSRGIITVRSGPGGGIFAAAQTPIARLGHSILSLDAGETDVADAVHIRNALDPLLIEDALRHAAAVDIARMRTALADMHTAMDDDLPTDFARANWELHAAIARVSPNTILKTIYLSLLELIASHTRAVLPAPEQSLPDYIAQRFQLHTDLVDALDTRDRHRALQLIHQHNTES